MATPKKKISLGEKSIVPRKPVVSLKPSKTFLIGEGDKLFRGNMSSDPFKSSSTEQTETNSAGSFFALLEEVSRGYGPKIHIFFALCAILVLDMSTVGGYLLLLNLIKTNTVMSKNETEELLTLFNQAYFLNPDGNVARISESEIDRPLFQGLQTLYSKGVFGDFHGIGNQNRIGTFHPEVYLFSVDWVRHKGIIDNTDLGSLPSVLFRKYRQYSPPKKKRDRSNQIEGGGTNKKLRF